MVKTQAGRLALLACLWAMPLLAGCTGSATVYTMPLLRTDLAPQEPPAQVVHARQAWYWLGPDGELNVALWHHAAGGRAGEYSWVLSLVLEGLPAGRERLYTLDTRSVRMVCSQGAIHQRAASFMGVAVVHAPRQGRLVGRFHATARQQVFSALTGWSPMIYRGPVLVMAGTFEAVHDPARGQALRDQAEADDFDRTYLVVPPLTTYPTPPSRPVLSPSP